MYALRGLTILVLVAILTCILWIVLSADNPMTGDEQKLLKKELEALSKQNERQREELSRIVSRYPGSRLDQQLETQIFALVDSLGMRPISLDFGENQPGAYGTYRFGALLIVDGTDTETEVMLNKLTSMHTVCGMHGIEKTAIDNNNSRYKIELEICTR